MLLMASTFISQAPQIILLMLIAAIVLSYKIEKRSPDLVNRSGLSRWAMFPHTITNSRVARDAKTQSLRRIMLWLLAAIVVLCILFAVAAITVDRQR